MTGLAFHLGVLAVKESSMIDSPYEGHWRQPKVVNEYLKKYGESLKGLRDAVRKLEDCGVRGEQLNRFKEEASVKALRELELAGRKMARMRRRSAGIGAAR
jgi:hypothetical protein